MRLWPSSSSSALRFLSDLTEYRLWETQPALSQGTRPKISKNNKSRICVNMNIESFLVSKCHLFSQKSDGGRHGRLQPRRDRRQQLCPPGLSGHLWQVWADNNHSVDNHEEWFPVRASFAVLNDVCDRCYDLFRDHDVHSLCRWAL